MLKTAGEAGEAGDVKTGWVRLSTSAPLRSITSNYCRRGGRASLPGDDTRRARRQTDRRPPRRATWSPAQADDLVHSPHYVILQWSANWPLSPGVKVRHFRRGGRASLPLATTLAARAGKLTVARGPPPSTFAQLRHTAVVSPLAVKSR